MDDEMNDREAAERCRCGKPVRNPRGAAGATP